MPSTQRSTKSSRGSPEKSGGATRSTTGELSAAQAAQVAIAQIAELTTKQPIGVTSVQPTEDGWLVETEVVEDAHIPSTSDMLALYEVDLDLTGDLLGYRRTRRYLRGRTDPGNGVTG